MTPPIGSDGSLDEILWEQFTSEFRRGYTTVEGVCLPDRYQEFAERIENFEVRDEDVWICSFPKTGTTWSQEMIWCIANDLDFQAARVRLSERFPFLDYFMLFDYTELVARKPEIRLPELVSNSVAHIEKQESPRFIKTHLPFVLLPRELRTGNRKPRIIYVARNPKDTCVSYYYHCRLMEGYRGDFNHFCRLFLGGKLSFAPYWDHVLDFWDRRDEENILFLKYEDMKSDLPKVIERVASFFGKTLSESGKRTLLEHLSFASMKSNPAVNYEDHVKLINQMRSVDVDGQFIRSGKIDQWKGVMSEEIVERFDRLTDEKFSSRNLLL